MIYIDQEPAASVSRIGSDIIQHFSVRIASMRSPDLGRHFEKWWLKTHVKYQAKLTSLWDSDSSQSNSILATKQ